MHSAGTNQANECIPNRKNIVFCDEPLEERA